MSGQPEILLKARRFSVVKMVEELRDGRKAERQVVVHGGSVVVLPLVGSDRICLIRNFRVAVGETLIELPAGTLEENEDPLEAARRELIEETGYRPGWIKPLHQFFNSPGILLERMHLFVAGDLVEGEMELEPGEKIERLVVPWEQALQMAVDGRIRDSKTLVGLLLWDHLQRGQPEP